MPSMSTGKDAVSTHSHPKVAAPIYAVLRVYEIVSTHSHPKVAARPYSFFATSVACFNTQPPEGGCAAVNLVIQ